MLGRCKEGLCVADERYYHKYRAYTDYRVYTAYRDIFEYDEDCHTDEQHRCADLSRNQRSVEHFSAMEQAASHCANYVETYKDDSGTVVHLKDWRLPTEAEINIIIRFQYAENAAMDEVLAGQKYWSATGEVVNPQSSSSNGTQSAVRCIRNAFK